MNLHGFSYSIIFFLECTNLKKIMREFLKKFLFFLVFIYIISLNKKKDDF